MMDRAHFEQLFRLYYGALCTYAQSIVGDVHAAEDVVQAVFLRVWERRGAIDARGPIRAYLYRSVRNASYNHLKHTRVAKAASIDLLSEYEQKADPDGEEQLVYLELERRFARKIAGLPGRCRRVFVLSRSGGLSYAEIAERLSISVKTVEAHMSSALVSLRSDS